MSLYAERDTSHTLTPREPLVDQSQKPESVIVQYVGYVSACWENLSGAGVFDSVEAFRAVEELLDYVESLGVDLKRETT